MTQSLSSRLIVSLAFPALLTVPAAGAQSNSIAAAAESHSNAEPVLMPGDALRITVWRMPELTGDEVAIEEDGSLDHPFYRTVRVAGLVLADAKSRLTERLRQVQSSPEFVVRPLVRITVFGEVRQPNVFRHPPETSIADAVAMAGGVSDRGNDKHVRLLRGGKVFKMNLRDPLGPATRVTIRSGDQITVGRRGPSFREFILPVTSLIAAAAGVANLIR
jgi:protein involved in polysaccharide export with SLBB domain